MQKKKQTVHDQLSIEIMQGIQLIFTGFQTVSDMDYTSDADNNKNVEETIEVGLWPPVVNVASKAMLHANATCGQNHREDYCHPIDAHPQRQRKAKCGICESHDVDRRHPIEYVIDGSQKWWQSPTLHSGAENEYITITMDLKQVCWGYSI